METELYKSRSHSACIKAAYILFSTHLTTVFKRTWLPVLVYSIVLAALIILYMPNKAWTDAGLSTPFERLLIMGGVDVLALASSVWIATVLASLFNGLPKRSNLLHSLLLNVFLAGIILLAAIVLREGDVLAMKALFSMKMSAETAGVASWGILILLATIIGAALLPLAFSLMKYWIEPDMKLSVVFGKAYRRGLRHWGFLFITLFVMALIFGLILFVLSIPFGIIAMAQVCNQIGILQGDLSGIPSGFSVLLYGTALITFFLSIYLVIWSIFVLYYAYGSIEATERERGQI